MRTGKWMPRTLVLLAIAGATAFPATALPILPAGAGASNGLFVPIAPSTPTLVIDRPEIRSFQPYSGLQFGFRPTPPVQRGVRSSRPQVIMPKPVAPLIEYGNPPHLSLGYAYCAEQPNGTVEPLARSYAAKPLPARQCP